MEPLQTLAANQLSVKTLASLALPDHTIRTRAAFSIQTVYRTMIAARKQRLVAEVKKMNDRQEDWEKRWEITESVCIGVAGGWMGLQKWDYVDEDFNKDFIYCDILYQYDKKRQCLVYMCR